MVSRTPDVVPALGQNGKKGDSQAAEAGRQGENRDISCQQSAAAVNHAPGLQDTALTSSG